VLPVYVPEGTRALVDGVVAALQPQSEIGFSLGEEGAPPASSVRIVEVKDGAVLKLGDLTVRAAENTHFSHPGPKKPNEPISLSYRFTLGNRSITFTGDTGPSDAVTKLASGSDMLVSEVIDLDPILKAIRQKRPDADPEMFAHMQMHLSTHHLQPDAVGEMAAAADVGHVVLTHFAIPPTPLSQSEQDLRSGVRRHFRGPLDLARDLASYDVGCSGH
jgi:ribonuclease BN (tRNA processing enzyme)